MRTTTPIASRRRRVARRATTVTALAGCVLVLGSVLAPASADSVKVHDPAGDKSDAYVDITAVKYTNGANNLQAVVHGVDLRKPWTYVGLTIRPNDGSGVYYSVGTYGRIGELGYVKFLQRTNGGSQVELNCGMTVNWFTGKNYVVITIPQDCVGSHEGAARMRGFLEYAYSEGGAGDYAPLVSLEQD